MLFNQDNPILFFDTSDEIINDKRPLICLDLDGVIADNQQIVLSCLLDYYKEEGKTFNEFNKWQTDVYSITQRLKEVGLLDKFEEMANDTLHIFGPKYMDKVEPMTGLIHALEILTEDYRIAVMSGRNETHAGYAIDWMQNKDIIKYFCGWCGRYDNKGRQAPKHQLCAEIKPAAIVDDNLGELLSIYENLPESPVKYLFKHGAPTEVLSKYEDEYKINAVNSWDSVVKSIKENVKPYSKKINHADYIAA